MQRTLTTRGQLRDNPCVSMLPTWWITSVSGSTQSNEPWITKNVLPTAHSHVHNRIEQSMDQSSWSPWRFISVSSSVVTKLFRTLPTSTICHTSCILINGVNPARRAAISGAGEWMRMERVMTVHKLSAGDGYAYYTSEVASGDELRAGTGSWGITTPSRACLRGSGSDIPSSFWGSPVRSPKRR